MADPDPEDTRDPRPARTLPAFTPVPRLKERSNGWSPAVQLAFIEALAETGSVNAACRRVRRTTVGAYLLRRHPEAESFRRAWEAALDIGIQRIEDVAMDRALNGVEVPVYSYGKLVGTRTVYNDRLLMFMLRNRSPTRFADGRAKGMNALDRQTLARLKREWRREWEHERAILDHEESESVLHELNARLDAMRLREEELARIMAEDAEAALDHADDEEPQGPTPEQLRKLPGYKPPVEPDERGWRMNIRGERWQE